MDNMPFKLIQCSMWKLIFTVGFFIIYVIIYFYIFFINITYSQYDIGDIMSGAACGAGNAYPSGAPGFTLLSFSNRMKIWQRPIVGHVQMTFIVNQSNLSLPDSESGNLSSCLYGVFWLAGEIPSDGNKKGRLHMTSYGSLSDLHTIVER